MKKCHKARCPSRPALTQPERRSGGKRGSGAYLAQASTVEFGKLSLNKCPQGNPVGSPPAGTAGPPAALPPRRPGWRALSMVLSGGRVEQSGRETAGCALRARPTLGFVVSRGIPRGVFSFRLHTHKPRIAAMRTVQQMFSSLDFPLLATLRSQGD